MDTGLKVLIVDDQPAVVTALRVLFDIHGIPSLEAGGPDEALRIASSETLGAVVQDMNYNRNETSGEAGVELFRRLREIQPELPVLLMTAWASLETAVELVKEGASDYIQKPWDDEKLIAAVKNLLRMRELEIENVRLRDELTASRRALAERFDLCEIVYASEAMHRVISLATSVAGSNAPVLVTGPSGSGKERIAEIVQANSRRADRPFIRVNVGAIPEELMEAELFGAEAGAYTGARSRRVGHFEAADSGTLFLDEVNSLSLGGQIKLLRVLQSGEFQRLGSSKTQKVDVRVLSASNANLQDEIDEGRFREDLFFRLNVVELEVPGLSDRAADILPLARHFLSIYAEDEVTDTPDLAPDAEHALLEYSWPGNVRELENRIRRAMLVGDGSRISAADLNLGGDPQSGVFKLDLSEEMQREKQDLLDAIAEADGVVAHAASALGLSRQALYRKMARLGIELERRPKT